MAAVVIGVLVGVFLGVTFYDGAGTFLGALLGGLSGMVIRLSQRASHLENAVKELTEQLQQLRAKNNSTVKNDPLAKNNPSAKKTGEENPAATSDTPAQPDLKTRLNAQAIEAAQHAIQQRAESQHPAWNKDALQSPSIDSSSNDPVDETLTLDLPDFNDANEKPEVTTPEKIAHVATKPSTSPTPSPWAPPVPTEPTLGDKLVGAVRRFFTEGNPIVRVGMVIMFFGVSFLVKYASSQGLIPIELRLAGVLLGAIGLLVVGWKTRLREGAYGLVLQGGGIAVIYLTLFAAAKIYSLIPLNLAFVLLFVVVMLGVALALLQNAQVLAILSTAGGFLAPILTSTGEGSHVGLFSFYLILNIGILIIAVYKAWRLLNWVGFMFTFVITSAWGVLKYEPIFYSTTQPFLIAFFLLYLTVSVLFSFKQTTNVKGLVDGSLIFGLPLFAFGLQTALLKHTEHGLAISAVGLSAIYIGLSLALSRRHLQTQRVLIESFLALGISFATLAIPLALDASWTSVSWALEATGLIWVGLRQARLRPRVVGYLLHTAATISLVLVNHLHTGDTPIISGDFLGLMLLSITALVIAYLLDVFSSKATSVENALGIVAIGLGWLWWLIAGGQDISAHVDRSHQFAANLLLITFTAVLFMFISKRLSWPRLHASVYVLLPCVGLASLGAWSASNDVHPTQAFGVIALLLFFAVQYRYLFEREHIYESSCESDAVAAATTPSLLLRANHIFTAWFLFFVLLWEAAWQKQHWELQGTASLLLWFAVFAIPLVFLIGAVQKKIWPFVNFESDYKNTIPFPLFVLMGGWFFIACQHTPGADPHYIPLLNPLDLSQFAIVLVFGFAVRFSLMDKMQIMVNNSLLKFLGILLFIWINVVVIRAVSHYEAIAYELLDLWNAPAIQMALSILWALCALLIMNLSRRLQRRELWITGAVLIALVVVKLFTKDLMGSGTLARIISFLVVGGLMLLIGYLSPIPAKIADMQSDSDSEKTNKG